MIVELNIDTVLHRIDTRDQTTLARWLIEQFDSVNWTPATWCRVMVWPTYTEGINGGRGTMDWIADTRIINELNSVTSPEEFIRVLQTQLDEYRELYHE